MVFYKIEAAIDKAENNIDFKDRKALKVLAEEIAEKSETFYQKSKQQHFVFVVSNRNEKITLGMILKVNGDKEKVFTKYQKLLPFKFKNISFDEITFKAMHSLLNGAWRNDFIYDNDDVLDSFDISGIVVRYCNISYGESMLQNDIPSEKVFNIAANYLFSETLIPELERIYSPNINKEFIPIF